MFSETATYYDALYDRVKDFEAESARIAALVRELRPDARTVLDAGCGTGRHARALSAHHGFAVDGFDLDPGMVRIAAARNPAGRFTVADLASFELAREYDVVLCLFGSIGYVRTLPGLERTMRGFARHLAPAGVVLVEPWFAPGVLRHGTVKLLSADTAEGMVCRMSRTVVDGRFSRLEFEYLVGGGDGIRRFSEVHELGLFTDGEMLGTFRAAGFDARYDAEGLTGRGLYVGLRP